MYAYTNFITDRQGNAVQGAQVEAYEPGTTTLVNIYPENSTDSPSTSTLSDSQGKFTFYIENARVDLKVSIGATVQTVPDALMFDPVDIGIQLDESIGDNALLQAKVDEASGYADDASASATASANSATDSENSSQDSLQHLRDFRASYIGAAAVDPTVDGNGGPLTEGDLYYNDDLSNQPGLRAYDGVQWYAWTNGIPANAYNDNVYKSFWDFLPYAELPDIISGISTYDVTNDLRTALSSGRRIYVPPGSYRFSDTITLASGMFLSGNAAPSDQPPDPKYHTIFRATTATAYFSVEDSVDAFRVQMRDFVVDAQSNPFAFVIGFVSKTTLVNLTALNASDCGYCFSAAQNSSSYGLQAKYCRRSFAFYNDAQNNSFYDCQIENPSSGRPGFMGSSDVRYVYVGGTRADTPQMTDEDFVGTGCTNNRFIGGVMEYSNDIQYVMEFAGAKSLTYMQNVIVSGGTTKSAHIAQSATLFWDGSIGSKSTPYVTFENFGFPILSGNDQSFSGTFNAVANIDNVSGSVAYGGMNTVEPSNIVPFNVANFTDAESPYPIEDRLLDVGNVSHAIDTIGQKCNLTFDTSGTFIVLPVIGPASKTRLGKIYRIRMTVNAASGGDGKFSISAKYNAGVSSTPLVEDAIPGEYDIVFEPRYDAGQCNFNGVGIDVATGQATSVSLSRCVIQNIGRGDG